MGKVLRCPLAYRSDGACAGTHAPRAPKRRVSPGFAVPRRFSAYLGGKTPGYAVPRHENAGIRRRPCAAYLGLGQCTLFVFCGAPKKNWMVRVADHARKARLNSQAGACLCWR